MSGRFRRRYRSNYGRRSFGSRSRFSRFGSSTSVARRARGNARAANQQADSTDVVINLMHKTSAGCAALIDNEKIVAQIGTAAINIFDLLAKSEFFNCYAPMYDQFKITSIKVKVTPVQWNTFNQQVALNNGGHLQNVAAGDGGNPPEHIRYVSDKNDRYVYPQGLTVVTAWDRTGLDASQIYEPHFDKDPIATGVTVNDGTYVTSHELQEQVLENNNDYVPFVSELEESQTQLQQNYFAWYTNIGDNITTYSSAQTKQLTGGSSFNLIRYLYPSTQQEKAQYFSTNDLVKKYTRDQDSYYYTPDPVDPNNDALGIKRVNTNDLTALQCNPSIPFKPTFLIGILGSNDLQKSGDNVNNKMWPVKFNLEFDIGVTFRGLRKTQVV